MSQTTPNPTAPEIAPEHKVFRGDRKPHRVEKWPDAPPWRRFDDTAKKDRGAKYHPSDDEILAVNLAIHLRRPLLVTGRPGVGKSTLAHAVAHELELGECLVWPITSRSTLQQGLYNYDAIGRLQEAALAKEAGEKAADIGRYVRLGPLGTAFEASRPNAPRVLLVDELDKSDIDLPNDLLHIFEEGEFEIPELARLPEDVGSVRIAHHKGNGYAEITRGRVKCAAFPIVIITSNGERDFPPAFLRRCLQLATAAPDETRLRSLLAERLGTIAAGAGADAIIAEFIKSRDKETKELATDQLLNAVHLLGSKFPLTPEERAATVLRPLAD